MNIKNAKGRESSEFLDADELRKIEAFAKKVKEKKTELYKKRKEEGIDFGRITAEIQPRVQKMAKAEERRWLEEHNPVVLNAIDEIGFPVIIRPSFTLGGTGGSTAYNIEDFKI